MTSEALFRDSFWQDRLISAITDRPRRNAFIGWMFSISFIVHSFYGVVTATGNTLPLKRRCPLHANWATYAPISCAVTGDSYCGNAFASISVCAEPKARQFILIIFGSSSMARHSVSACSAALLAE